MRGAVGAVLAAALAAALLGVVGSGTTAQPALAQPAMGQLGMQLVLGYDGIARVAGWTPATVSFRADRPVSGRVEVTSSGLQGDQTVTQPLEVAAGAPVVVRMVVPPGRVSARVVSDGEVADRVAERSVDRPGLVLGVLDAVAVDGPSVEILPLAVSGRWVGVDQAWTDVPHGLASLDALVLPPGAWGELDEAARTRVWSEVTLGGMTLVTTDPVDAALLPRALDLADPPVDGHLVSAGRGGPAGGPPPAALTAPAGLGRVALVPGGPDVVRDGDVWAAVTGPRGVVDPIVDFETYDTQAFAAQQLFVAASGIDVVAGIPYLGAFLLAYLLVVGPLNLVLLRRWGRPDLAWVTVPAVALLFAAVPLVATRSGPADAPLTGQTLTWWVEGAGQERLALAWQPTRTGPVRAVLDGEGWTALAWGDSRGATVLGAQVAVEGEARVGEIAGLLASRPVASAPPLQVQARLDGADVVVDVVNDAAVAVRDLTVVVGNQAEQVGDLAAGQRLTHTVEGRLVLTRLNVQAMRPHPDGPELAGVVQDGVLEQNGMAVESEMVLPDGTVVQGGGFGPFGPFGQAAGLFPAPLRLGTPGVAWAVATVDAAAPPAQVQDAQGEPLAGTVAVGARVAVGAPADQVPPAAVLSQTLVSAAVEGPLDPSAPTLDRVALRFRLPPLAPSSVLSAALSGVVGAQDVQVWDATGRTWRDVPSDATGLDPAALLTATGELYVRMIGPVDGAGIAVTRPGDPPAPGPLEGPPGFVGAFPPFVGPMGVPTMMPLPVPTAAVPPVVGTLQPLPPTPPPTTVAPNAVTPTPVPPSTPGPTPAPAAPAPSPSGAGS